MTISQKQLSPKDLNFFKSHHDRITLLYQWIQNKKITVDQFRDLLEIHKNEDKRQILLDSPN